MHTVRIMYAILYIYLYVNVCTVCMLIYAFLISDKLCKAILYCGFCCCLRIMCALETVARFLSENLLDRVDNLIIQTILFYFYIYQNSLVVQSDQNICVYRLKRPGKVSLFGK